MATITVMNGNDSGAGSLRAALAAASAGDIVNFSVGVTTVDLSSTLAISKNVTIEGLSSSGTPGVTISGQNQVTVFKIDHGVTATFDGLIITGGKATGTTGSAGTNRYGGFEPGGTGGAVAGGIYDAGSLTLTHSVLENNFATGGTGGAGYSARTVGRSYFYASGGGAGGSAAGGIYVAQGAALNLASSDSFGGNSGTGGTGGQGGDEAHGLLYHGGGGGAGGTGGKAGVNGGIGSSGGTGAGPEGGSGGPARQAGSPANGGSAGGGGGGGMAFADVGGKGAISSGPVTRIVTSAVDDINTVGSLRYELAIANAGDTITFAANVTTIDLSSTLEISKNITIEGLQPGSTTPVTISGQSKITDFVIDAGVTATFDGLIIANGHATGAPGAYSVGGVYGGPPGNGGAAAGGIFDSGVLTLTHSVLLNDTATGGTGGSAGVYDGGGAGGSAAGAIYVARAAKLYLAASDEFRDNTAAGGAGGHGGAGGFVAIGGAGGAGGTPTVNDGIGSSGSPGELAHGGGGGGPGTPGSTGNAYLYKTFGTDGPGGGGGGGTAFADAGGKGSISGAATVLVTNASDDINTVGSLRYDLAIAHAGDTIAFDSSVATINLTSSLVITKNVTIEGAQPGATTPGVTINGGGSGSNFSDFIVEAGATASFDGLIIADGHAIGAAGTSHLIGGGPGGPGGAAAGGIFDAGSLKLTNSLLLNDAAVGGNGGYGGSAGVSGGYGGGAGGTAAGGIYVTGTGKLNLYSSDSFTSDSAIGGTGGSGGDSSFIPGLGYFPGGNGGAGGMSGVNRGVGSSGYNALPAGGHGGGPGQPGHGSNSPNDGGGGGGGGFAFADVGGTGTITGPVPCYCPGTRILTARGEKRVETLEVGDEIMTASAVARPIKWIGRRSYAGRFVLGRKDILPVCIKAGALDANVPARDLWISPHHAMYLDGVLIEAKDLVNGVSVVQAERVEKVEYFHVELDSHDVIIAEGAPSETYLDDGNRLMFHNAPDYYARHRDAAMAPAYYCAPRLEEGYEIEAVRKRIAARAGTMRSGNSERPAIKVYRRANTAQQQ
jgi:hypothetical protein